MQEGVRKECFLLAGVVWMMQECACTQQRAPFAAQRSYLSTFAGSRRCASLCSMGCAWWLGGWVAGCLVWMQPSDVVLQSAQDQVCRCGRSPRGGVGWMG